MKRCSKVLYSHNISGGKSTRLFFTGCKSCRYIFVYLYTIRVRQKRVAPFVVFTCYELFEKLERNIPHKGEGGGVQLKNYK